MGLGQTISEVTVALSGTLDTFELPDVLRLLASTAKTGRLRITGDRGTGSVWVDDGKIVTTELSGSYGGESSDEECVFGMLRFAAGSFTFEADAVVGGDFTSRDLEPVLGAAESMLVEWRLIEEVVPSLDEWIVLAEELDGPDVMIGADRWRSIATIGSGAPVLAVAKRLELNEMNACRVVKELIELGLVELSERPVNVPASSAMVATDAEAAEIEDVAPPAAAPTAAVAEVETDEVVAASAPQEFAPAEPDIARLEEVPLADDTGVAALDPAAPFGDTEDPILAGADLIEEMGQQNGEAVDVFAAPTAEEIDSMDLDPAEMARQLANLSPKAAKAVAAAARANTEAERDAALAAVEAEDDSVNRGLLLKFLGSVDS